MNQKDKEKNTRKVNKKGQGTLVIKNVSNKKR